MIHRLSSRPLLTLRPSLTARAALSEVAPVSAEVAPSTGNENSLREALLGPSIVAVALGSLVVRPRDEKETPKETAPPTHVALPQPSALGAFLARASALRNSYARGETVAFCLEIENVSGAPATLVFGSGQQFEFEAQCGEQKWNWSAGQTFSHGLQAIVLSKGEILRWNCEWKTANSDAGHFDIRAICLGNGGIAAPSFSIELV